MERTLILDLQKVSNLTCDIFYTNIYLYLHNKYK